MKKLIQKASMAAVVLFASMLLAGCGTYQNTSSGATVYDYGYNNPTWAPVYYSGVRYYYFPDIECYYDLATRDFIVLNMGQWLFVQSIMPFYSTFDLYNSYIVILNTSVYQPWMHHQYYIRHYPRYYYLDYYDYSNIPYVRGFNENQKGAIYWSQNERSKARPWDDRNLRNNRNFSYSSADRRVQQETTRMVNEERAAQRTSTSTTRSTATQNTGTTRQSTTTTNTGTNRQSTTTSAPTRTSTTTTTAPTRTSTTTTAPSRTSTTTTAPTRSSTQTTTAPSRSQTTDSRRSEDVNYYGRPIGNPVRVEPQMRQSESTTRSSGSTSTSQPTRSSSSSTGGRR